MIIINCKSIEQTQALGVTIGESLKGGEVLELKSDLGGGKTTFVKGLAAGMGVTGVVQSPTFTISFIHKGSKDLELHHFDFYRLQDAGIMSAELTESLQDPKAVVAIEWGNIVHDILPKNLISITLNVKNDESREVKIDIPEELNYITKAIEEFKNDTNN